MKRILIVDNSTMYSEMCAEALEKDLGIPVVIECAQTAKEVLEKFPDLNNFDFFIIDFQLGNRKMNGLKLVQLMRKKGVQPPVVMLSGDLYQELLETALKNKLVFIDKSISRFILVNAVRFLLQKGTSHFIFYLAQDDSDKTIGCLFPYRNSRGAIGFYETAGLTLERETGVDVICISTQTSCAMGCQFCSSTKKGGGRNLTVEELWAQIKILEALKGFSGQMLVSLMGIGEPLKNFDNVKSLICNAPPQYRFALSTIGLIPDLQRLADDKELMKSKKIELIQISVHFPFDWMREIHMPATKGHRLENIKHVCQKIKERSAAQICLNFTLWEDKNDTEECAKEMVKLASDWADIVRISRANSFGDYNPTDLENEKVFISEINSAQIPYKIFISMGERIKKGCGQMKGEIPHKKEKELEWK